ncbi:MAG: hypothetical protein KDK74_09730, partial [Cephaloticoccus sp.]|nr:hypothetical protein [Cephaloticoccus sp.]
MSTNPRVPDVSLHGLEEKSDILVFSNQQYWEFHPTEEPLALSRVERTPDGIGLVLRVATAFPFGSLEITGEGVAQVTVNGDTFTVRFPDANTLEPALHKLTLTAISTTGERTAPHHIGFHYASAARDALNNRVTRNRVIVKDTDLQVAFSRVADWVIETPTDDDRAYAQNRWGALTANLAGAYAKARVITRAVIDDFEPQRGTPSDKMNRLHPFRQHERILAGIDHGWCANMAEILCH